MACGYNYEVVTRFKHENPRDSSVIASLLAYLVDQTFVVADRQPVWNNGYCV